MSDIAIQAHGLSKRYQLGERCGYRTLRESLVPMLGSAARRVRSLMGRGGPAAAASPDANVLWALDDVSFEVQRGEVVGIIGTNGSGKSTLLKILSRVTEPTRGHADIRGRVGSLLEVGTGFHPELTGAENIFLNGTILGMSRAEVKRKFDEIVAFAEVGRFIHTPVKRYSSGMYMRLAFAVAAHLDPEIMLVDEVLAVGDAAFQKKCMGKMSDVSKRGRTVLFVSHNTQAVRSLCTRVLWIQHGKLQMDGPSDEVVKAYLASMNQTLESSAGLAVGQGDDRLRICGAQVRNSAGEVTSRFHCGESVTVEVRYDAPVRVAMPCFWITIYGQRGPVCTASMLLDGAQPDHLEGQGTLTCVFRDLPLMPQTYTLTLGVRDRTGKSFLARTCDVGYIDIVNTAAELGLHGGMADSLVQRSAPVRVQYEWQFDDGRIVRVGEPGANLQETQPWTLRQAG